MADVQDAEKRIRDLIPVTPLKVRAPPPLRGHGKWTSFYASVASLDGLRNLSCCPSCWGLTCSSKETSTFRRAGEGVGVVGGSDPTTGPVCVWFALQLQGEGWSQFPQGAQGGRDQGSHSSLSREPCAGTGLPRGQPGDSCYRSDASHCPHHEGGKVPALQGGSGHLWTDTS